MMIGIINYYYNSKGKNRRRDNGRGGAVALTHHYSPSFQPKTTTNNIFNPKDASNIHSQHHHYHIGFPHIGESPFATLVHICFS